MYIDGAIEVPVQSMADVHSMIARGKQNRQVHFADRYCP
jgi:hypothetical protein